MEKLSLHFRNICFLSGAASAGWLLAIPAAVPQETTSEQQDSQFDGQWRYEVSCAPCHGANGQGLYPLGNPLRGNVFVQTVPAQTIIDVIQNGRYNRNKAYPAYSGMPAFDYIRAGEARAVVAYMKGQLQEQE